MEKRERIKLERRLRLAEDSLKRLDGALRDSGLKVSLEIEADVTTLKSFFEDAAQEAEIQAKKHLLMEEAVRAKKNYERAVYKKNEDMFQARKINTTDQTRKRFKSTENRKRYKSTPTFYDDYRTELARQDQRQNATLFQTKPNSRISQRQTYLALHKLIGGWTCYCSGVVDVLGRLILISVFGAASTTFGQVILQTQQSQTNK
eukprot:sb/3470528/